MTRGTTPTITIRIGIRPSRFSILFITAKQSGNVVFERTLDQMTVSESAQTVAFRLTQEETLGMSSKSPVYIQARGKLFDETVVASDLKQISVGEILKEGVI